LKETALSTVAMITDLEKKRRHSHPTQSDPWTDPVHVHLWT